MVRNCGLVVQEPTAARANSLTLAGMLAGSSGEYDEEQRLHHECLAIRRVLGNEKDVAYSLVWLALAARNVCNYTLARTLSEESLEVAERTEDKRTIANALIQRGSIIGAQGDYALARSCLERSVAISTELGYKRQAAAAHRFLISVERAQGDFTSAWAHVRESLALQRDSGFQRWIPSTLIGAAGLAAVEGQAMRAARLFGAAEALCETMGVHLSFDEREEYERDVAIARSGLDEPAFAAAWAEGRAMSLDEAVQYALEDAAQA